MTYDTKRLALYCLRDELKAYGARAKQAEVQGFDQRLKKEFRLYTGELQAAIEEIEREVER